MIVKLQTFTYSYPFIYEHNRGMLRLVSFTNTVTRFTKELDKTNLFVKLKKKCTVEVLNKNVKKMTLVLRTHSIYKKPSDLHVRYM